MDRLSLQEAGTFNFASGENYDPHMEILRCGCTMMKHWGIFCPEHAPKVHELVKEKAEEPHPLVVKEPSSILDEKVGPDGPTDSQLHRIAQYMSDYAHHEMKMGRKPWG